MVAGSGTSGGMVATRMEGAPLSSVYSSVRLLRPDGKLQDFCVF